ncbi:MAG TPA: PTS sugar transporter subunit IIA [bacterium]|nr:PTS sugar transporter subunit IIA [bacterium]
MKLSSLLNSDLIIFQDSLKNRNEAIDILAEMISKHLDREIKKEIIITAVEEREQLADTTLGNGICIPHARIADFQDIIIAAMVLETPLEEPDRKIKMIFLILTSKTSSNLYLQTLSSIAQIASDTELADRLLRSGNPDSFISVISDSGIKVKKEITVENIMNKCFISVKPETTVKEVIDIFVREKLTFVPVADKDGSFKGEVHLIDIIASGLPDYARMIGNMNFLSSIEPFEEMLRHEDSIPVKNIMKMPPHRIHPSTPVVELALRLTETCRKCITVEKDGKIEGVVSLSDILNKLLRA